MRGRVRIKRSGETVADADMGDRETAAISIVRRVLAALEAESRAASEGGFVDYDAHNLAKSRGLLELNRLLPSLAGEPYPRLRAALAELNAALADNERKLRVQLSAARAVADLIARAISDSQSDGTYCASGARDGNP